MPMLDSALLFSAFIYAAIGALAGLMAGILGIGGGVVVVPGLLLIFQQGGVIPPELSMHVAAGTSLAVMIITSQSALHAHLKMGEVLWSSYKKLALGIFGGTIAGAFVATLISIHWLKVFFALFLLLIAIKMISDLHVTHTEKRPPNWVNRVVSFLIGFKSGLLGVGGGVLVVPYLTYCGVAIRQIAAISNLCTFTVALVGSASFMILGYQEMAQVPYATGYVYWPAVLGVSIPSSLFAPLGAKLNYVVPVKQLKYIFIVMLLVTAAVLLH